MSAHRTDDPDEGWEGVASAIDDDRPVLVQCDLSHLPYWDSSTPFNGHRIVVAGYNDEAGEALVADTHFEGLQRICLDDLAAARASKAPPSMGNQHAWWVLEPGEPAPLEEAIVDAIVTNAREIEEDVTGFGGLAALREFADGITSWVDAEDAAWCYRFGAQCIETRGTGGGMFRYLYRDFLREAADYVTEITRHQLDVSMTKVGESWSTLSTYMEAMATYIETDGEEPDDDPRHHLESMAEAVYQFESTFWDRVGIALG